MGYFQLWSTFNRTAWTKVFISLGKNGIFKSVNYNYLLMQIKSLAIKILKSVSKVKLKVLACP